jgi:lipopolysaccharide export system protein LptC
MTAEAPEATHHRSARRERDMRRWQRRSVLIGVFRRALPGGIALIFLLFGAWLVFGGLVGRISQPRGPGPSAIHMSNAHFLGRDNDGRAFVLTAVEAARDNADSQRITLTRPTLTLDADSPKATHLTADSGVYREDNRMLMLNGHVSLHDGQGDTFVTDQAIVDTIKGAVAGQSPITGQGPSGSISAESYAVYDHGQRLVFQGKVHSRINAH